MKLDAAPTSDVVLNFSLSDASEGRLSSNTFTFTSENWNIAQTLTVFGIDDFEDDGDQLII